MVDLAALGWGPRFEGAFAELGAPNVVPARVALEHTHIYRLITESGELLARVSGRLRHHAEARADFPAVGDWVAVELPVEGGDARIRAVLPRFSRFSRRAAGDPTEEQIVAANIDVVFLVSGLDHDFNHRRIERYLVVAWESGATPVIVLNKADLVEELEPMLDDVRSIAPGVDIHAVTCHVPGSVDVLRPYIGQGQTGALLGMSGVGKSSIVNQLLGQELIRTRDVRIHDSRGRHTTTARQLVMLPGHGVLIDTPGMRELQLWDTGESMAGTFADIEAFAEQCRFRDCQHQSEPGCAVRAAVDGGELASVRLESFHKLAAEQAYQLRQQDQRAQIEAKRIGKLGAKAMRRDFKGKGKN